MFRTSIAGPLTWAHGLRAHGIPPDGSGAGASSGGGEAGSQPDAGSPSTPDATAGDGESDATLDWSEVPGLGPSRPARPSAAQASGDEDDDDSDLELDPTDNSPAEERVKKLAAALKRAKGKLRKARTSASRVQGIDLDDLTYKARSYERLEQQLRANPRLRALVDGDEGTDTGPSATTRRPSRPAAPPAGEWDPSSLPYDPEQDDVNRHMARRDRDLHDVQRTVAEMAPMVERIAAIEERLGIVFQQERNRSEAAEKGAWKAATDHALRFIPNPADQETFKELVVRDFLLAKQGGRRLDPRKAIERIFDAFKKQGRVRAIQRRPGEGAAAQRMAEGNRSLPRPGAMVGGSAAPARDKSKERISDVHTRFLGRQPGR